MWDYTIGSLLVQDVTGVDTALQPTVTKRVTFMVGRNGPFTLTYSPAQYSAERVLEDINKEVAILRALHDSTRPAG